MLVVDGSQIAEHDWVLRVKLESLDVGLRGALEDASLLEHVAQVDVSVQERRIQLHCLITSISNTHTYIPRMHA